MRTPILADGPTPKKHTHKIGLKHRTTSEKEKKGTPKVFQRLYVFQLYAQRNHSLKTGQIFQQLRDFLVTVVQIFNT